MRAFVVGLVLAATLAVPALGAGGSSDVVSGTTPVAGIEQGLKVQPMVRLRIANDFTAYERAKVLQAVNEWNLALNGVMRFEIVDEASATDGGLYWTVVVNRTRSTQVSLKAGYVLGLTLRGLSGSGVVLLNAAEIGSKDMTAVMRHELGHALGLEHDPRGGLMVAEYSPFDQSCIDKRTLASLAAHLGISPANFHGCENR